MDKLEALTEAYNAINKNYLSETNKNVRNGMYHDLKTIGNMVNEQRKAVMRGDR